MATSQRTRDRARTALGWIRFVNGLAALLAPGLLAGRLGVNPDASPATLYVFRMFGIRTVLIGWDLIQPGAELSGSQGTRAVVIHASDTLAAFLAARSARFPAGARFIVAISALNTALALIARR